VIVEIQCLANPPGTADDRFKHIDAAIAVVQASGLTYEVGALGTTIEGEANELWPLVRAIHDACLAAGAESLVSVVKFAEAAAAGTTMESLTAKFRVQP